MFDRPVKPPDNTLAPELTYEKGITKLIFGGKSLSQEKLYYIHGTVVNIYTVYEIIKNNLINRYPTLGNCLFGAAKITKIPI